MRALVVGAGAVGQYLAARLRAGDHDVVLLGRAATAAALQKAGVTLRADGRTHAVSVSAASDLADPILREPFELVVTAVKSYATPGAIESIKALPACSEASLLVVQNGLGNEELCASAFGADRVVAAALTTAVDRFGESGVIASAKGGLTIAPVGQLAHNWLIAAFETTGVKVAAATDWRALKWSKLCINLMANAVCAILDWTPEQVYGNRVSFEVERRCLIEAIATMGALKLSPVGLIDFPVPLLIGAVRTLPPAVLRPVLAGRVVGGRGGKLPSLLMDLRARRSQLEVEALNGAVAQRASAVGVATPGNAAVTRILQSIAAGKIDWNLYRGKPEALASAIS